MTTWIRIDETLTDFIIKDLQVNMTVVCQQNNLDCLHSLSCRTETHHLHSLCGNMVDVDISKANINKVEQKILSKLGPDLGSGFTAEDKDIIKCLWDTRCRRIFASYKRWMLTFQIDIKAKVIISH